jgi:hypothetical protein
MEDDSELKVLPRMEFSQDVGFFGPLIGFVLGIEFKGVGEEDGTKSDEGQEMVFHDFLKGIEAIVTILTIVTIKIKRTHT